MDNRQKKIMSIAGLIGVVMIFTFGWLIFNKDTTTVASEESEESAQLQEKEQTSEPPSEQATDEASMGDIGVKDDMASMFTYNESNEEEATETTYTNQNNPTRTEKPDVVKLGSADFLKIQTFIEEDGYRTKASIAFNGWEDKEHFLFGGVSYPEGLGFAVNYSTRNNKSTVVARYILNEEYSLLVGEVGIDDKSIDAKGNYRVEFHSQNRDNTTTFLSEVVGFKPGQFPTPFEVDVTGVPALLIKLVKLDEEDSRINITIVNTELK